MSNLEYISAAGLRLLLSMQRIMKAQGTMTVENVNEEIMEIFSVTGFVKILSITNSATESKSSLQQSIKPSA